MLTIRLCTYEKKNVLILTTYKDVHAIAAEVALSSKYQLDVTRWIVPAPGNIQNHSLNITNDSLQYNTTVTSNSNFDTVWLRRLAFPKLSDQRLLDEKNIMEKELRLFLTSIYSNTTSATSFWINPLSSLSQAEDKVSQLCAAKKVGLTIPNTLFSNDPLKIKSFISSSSSCIYKGFSQIIWDDSVFFASKVSIDDLPDDIYLENMPGIYQEEVRKKYELRVTMFGHHPIAVKITLKSKETDYVEWGQFSDEDLRYEEAKLPDKVITKLRLLMKELGIVFGCVDLIVTEEDEYVFLEVNQQGQFLWIEAANPEIYLLDAFIEFIAKGNVDYSGNKNKSKISLSSIFENSVFKEICKKESMEQKGYFNNAH